MASATEEVAIAIPSTAHSHGIFGGQCTHDHSHQHHQHQEQPPAVLNGRYRLQPHGHSHSHSDHQITPSVPLPSSPPPPSTPQEELFICAKTNNLTRFQELIALHGEELVQQRDEAGHTITHWVAQRGSAEFIEYIHELHAPLDLPSEDAVKLHPIHWACASGNLAAVKTLVKLGVDINTADVTKHRTPLLIAAQNGFPLLVMYLVKQEADVNLVDIDLDSAIHWAAYKGATEIVSVFQYLGLSSDAPDRYGQTPLHLAAMRGQLETVQYLVEELDADLHILDGQGRTPMKLAQLKQHRRVVNYLARQIFRHKWNVFSWWESSRAPYFFVLANVIGILMLYVGVLMPSMPDAWRIYMPHLLCTALMLLFFFLTKRTSPGDVSKDEIHKQEYTQVTEMLVNSNPQDHHQSAHLSLERPFCHSCHVQRPLRSKHCRVCKTCVHHFDHHCPFVDNCVGRDNYHFFLAFVSFLVVDLAVFEYLFYLHWSLHGFRAWVLCAMIYFAVLLIPVLQLCGFHLYLTAKNLTTNEVMNSHRYQYMRSSQGTYQNPFDGGVVHNFAERCLPNYALPYERVDRGEKETAKEDVQAGAAQIV